MIKKRTHGFTLMELIIAITLLAIVVPGLTVLLSTIFKGYSSYEAASGLKKNNQESINRIYLTLMETKRLFQGTAADNAFLAKVSLGADAPTVLSGSKLPLIEESGTLFQGTTNFVTAGVGNCLFFANNSPTQILQNVADSLGSTNTVRIDIYQFTYYYLSSQNSMTIRERQSYSLVEWTSISYADYDQINAIVNSTLKSNTVKKLLAAGVSFAWDSSETNAANAFFNLNANGTMTLSASHSIQRQRVFNLTRIMTGVLGSTYKYGVSPNSAGWPRAPAPVPRYASASGNFPGGLEVCIVGSSMGREVLVRFVVVAQGAMSKILGNDQTIICNVHDVW